MTTREGLLCTLHFSFEQPDWYPVIAGALAQVVQDSPLWDLFDVAESQEGKPVPLTPASLREAVEKPKTQGWELRGPHGDAVECTVHDEWLILRTTLRDASLRRFGPRIEELTGTFLGAFGAPLLLPVSGLRPWFDPDLPWQKLRPRPPAPYLAYENVVDVFDTRLPAAWADREGGPVMERILAAPTPAGVRRVERDGKVMLFWTDDLTDPSALADARMRHERWLAEQVRPGATDRRIEIDEQADAPPLSFVDPATRLGFKTVVVQPDGSLEQPAWDAALAVARSGQLAGVYVIVPLREQALSLRERALAAGLSGVAYPTGSALAIAGESA